MQRKKIFKTGIFIICLVAAAYFGVRMAFLMSAPFQHVNTGKEIDRVEVNNGNVIINVLVMGLDKDETRTDTLIFMSYNSANGKCFMMSIPRDTYVHINGNRVLINEAYTHGGAEATIKKVKELINLPVNYYVVFTFQDFRDVIDGLGGVEFDVRVDIVKNSQKDLTWNVDFNIARNRTTLEKLNSTDGYFGGELMRILKLKKEARLENFMAIKMPAGYL